MQGFTWLLEPLKAGVSRPRPSCLPQRHDDIVFTFWADKKTGYPLPVRELGWHGTKTSKRYLLGVTRINAKVYIAATESAEFATISVDANPISERTPEMASSPDLTPRAIDAILAVKAIGPCTAKDVAVHVAGPNGTPTDSRGWAQTLRRIIAGTNYVEKTDDGKYKMTQPGRSYANRILRARESGDSTTSGDEPETPAETVTEPAVD